MTIKPGASKNDQEFSDSLAESIENALKIEWLAVKGEQLSEAGKADRRILFAAVAQGFLDYLTDHQADFNCISAIPCNIIIQSPSLVLSPSNGPVSTTFDAKGYYFTPGNNVTIIWDNPEKKDIFAITDQWFSRSFQPPQYAPKGKHIVEARDESGQVAMGVFEIT